MFTQFFGNFLLNSCYITYEQLSEVLEEVKNTKIKLGVMAINSNLMTAEQVKKVHHMQSRVDKKFGEIAVQLGYMTDEQVMQLLSKQQNSYLQLSQTILDKGFMTLSDLEKALKDYKIMYKLDNINFSDSQNKMISSLISQFYTINKKEAFIYTDYIMILFKNIVRFIGDDFIPKKQSTTLKIDDEVVVSQNLKGNNNIYTAIISNKVVLTQFANRFSEEDFEEYNDFAQDCVGEFLNLVNGIFSVNQSNVNSLEYEQTPQTFNNILDLENVKNAILVPVHFTFGIVNFVIADID